MSRVDAIITYAVNLPPELLDKAPSGENTLNILRRRGITPRIVPRTEDVELMRSLVGRGAGYGMHFLGSAIFRCTARGPGRKPAPRDPGRRTRGPRGSA